MTPREAFVSVVVPLDNVAGLLERYLAELVENLRCYRDYEIIMVDDGSSDGTRALVDRLMDECDCLRYIRLAQRSGLDVAISAGLDTAIGDFVVVVEPGWDPPTDLPRFVEACQGGADVVIGTCEGRRRDGRFFAWGRQAFYWLCRRLITDRLPASATHFMAFSRRGVNAVTRIKQYNHHLGVVACTVGYGLTFLPYQQRPAPPGAGRRGLRAGLEFAIATLVTNSVSPLRLVTYISAFAGLANLLYIGYVCVINIVKNRVAEGWTTLSLQMSGMFFLVFLTLMVIAEYIAHTFQASKDPPRYQVLEERSSTRPFVEPERRNIVSDSPPSRKSA
jgi:glycosyltransferase involved in cell wall biosynthesis